MRRAMKALLCAGLLGACTPVQARAEGYVNPWAGVIFGNSQAASGFKSFGISLGDLGARVIGTETNVGFTPGFFGDAQKSYVLDITGGALIGPHIQGTRVRVHPYGAIGIGTIRVSIAGGTGDGRTTRNDWGISVGGGAIIDFSDRLGIRGDVRSFRGFNGESPVNSLNADLAHFHYWRGSIGLAIWY